MNEAYLKDEITALFDIRNQFIKCQSIDDIVHLAAQVSREQMRSQIASVYLFSKDDLLERTAIAGIDQDRQPIEDTWFPGEKYRRGESFTGKVVGSGQEFSYGTPWLSNNLGYTDIDNRSREAYTKTLGILICAAAVPINGQHRTYGVLEVINKIDEDKNVLIDAEFKLIDLYRLAIISNDIATAISNLRRIHELHTLTEINRLLVEPFVEGMDLNTVCDYITTKLVSDLFNYCLCVIRTSGYEGNLILTSWSIDTRFCADFTEDILSMETSLERHVHRSGQEEIVVDINTSSEFGTFLKVNCFTSFGCFPISIDEEKVGVLSLYTVSPDEFYENDKVILRSIASLIASLIKEYETVDTLQFTQRQLERISNRLEAIERQSDEDYWSLEILHRYKQDLISIEKSLEKALSESPGRQRSILQEELLRTSTHRSEIESEFNLSTKERIDINDLIREIVRDTSFSAEVNIRFTPQATIPDITGNPSIIKTIILNVIWNAVKAIEAVERRKGEIHIRTGIIVAGSINYIQIAVQDNGIGIRREVGEKIFDRGVTTYTHGTGMGLYIIRNILEDYGGTIHFESTLGKGTTFFVRIPLKRHLWKEED